METIKAIRPLFVPGSGSRTMDQVMINGRRKFSRPTELQGLLDEGKVVFFNVEALDIAGAREAILGLHGYWEVPLLVVELDRVINALARRERDPFVPPSIKSLLVAQLQLLTNYRSSLTV
jgi:hypothetical protein